MNCLIDPLLKIDEYNRILKSIRNYTEPITVSGPSESQKAHLCVSVLNHLGQKGLFIAYNDIQARKIYEDLAFFLGDQVLLFPSKEIMLHDVEAKSYDAVFQRLLVLDRIVDGRFSAVVTSAEALIQKLVPEPIFKRSLLSFKVGQTIDLEKTAQDLVSIGFERVREVEGQGQFSIRGGIIDIYTINYDNAIRMELFDDEIDSIRSFDVLSQRSIDKVDQVKIIPVRELIYTVEGKQRVIGNLKNDLSEFLKKVTGKNSSDYIRQVETNIRNDMDRIKNEHHFPGMDRFIPYIIEQPDTIIDYIPDGIVFADEPSRIRQRIENALLESGEACKGMLEKGRILPKCFELNFDYEAIREKLDHSISVFLNTMPVDAGKEKYKHISIAAKTMSSYQGHIDLLIEELKEYRQKDSKLIVLAGTRGRGERLAETLRSKGIEAYYAESCDAEILPGQIIVTHGSLNKGFEYPSIKLVVVSDKEIFGQERKAKRTSTRKKAARINSFTDLNLGDYVVHQAHGIGQYVGIQKLAVDNVKRDYLKIRYQEGDHLYIPTNQLDLIQKYIGSEGKLPKLNKLGGTEWSKTKKRVKESLKELAEGLVKLYAARQASKGNAYSPDTVWQRQFEEIFPYEETEDQLRCIEEIKSDMESARPMDRLLCGDVGYGKTEVAIRAIFKAVMDGKQVAYLVPTTILAQQHYSNFKERMKDFPVSVEVISRFRTPAEQKKILKDVKAGNVDVLIGTHRLLQKDIQFKDLGLLVVDEEQRFGVGHKERIKSLKPDIDVLTLTATPIPRTLHMSLVGIRDISTIEEPPEERYPVQTYVMEYNPDVLRDAVNREMARNGQVFYLYNKVRSIQLKAIELQALVPEARIAVAHGQMDEKQLEDIMMRFMNYEYDMLICTTIIESGLDMPNVNTIIVENADAMGLAQLYQLRGRVGRSNRLAYAYITYKKDKILSEVAEKRLSAIKEFTEFGSGFKIAMRDLEIRGAGNLLGPEQHGQMDSVGYDMYCRLLDEAVRELKGEPAGEDELEISIDVNISAYIDDSYIGSETQKIEMYKKIAAIQDDRDIMDIEDELTDRYGDMPQAVRNLIMIANIKFLGRNCGFASIQEKDTNVILQFKDSEKVDLGILSKLMDKYKRKLMFTASNAPYITFKATDIKREALLSNIKILLQDINQLK